MEDELRMSDEEVIKRTKFVANWFFWVSVGFAFFYITIQALTH